MEATKDTTKTLRAIEALSALERPFEENIRRPGPGGMAYDEAPTPPVPETKPDNENPITDAIRPLLSSRLLWIAVGLTAIAALGRWLVKKEK